MLLRSFGTVVLTRGFWRTPLSPRLGSKASVLSFLKRLSGGRVLDQCPSAPPPPSPGAAELEVTKGGTDLIL